VHCPPGQTALLTFCIHYQQLARLGCNCTMQDAVLPLDSALYNSTAANTTFATVDTCTAGDQADAVYHSGSTTGTTQAMRATTGQAVSRLGLFPSRTRSLRHANNKQNGTRTTSESNPQPHQDADANQQSTTQEQKGTEGVGCSCDGNAPEQTPYEIGAWHALQALHTHRQARAIPYCGQPQTANCTSP
jgi:hypothetical protein